MKSSGHVSLSQKSSRAGLIKRFLLFCLIPSIPIVFFGFSEAIAQASAVPNQRPHDVRTTVPSAQESPAIGDSGFRVPIPEIKMKQIIGGPSESKTLPPEDAGKVAPQAEKSQIEKPADETASGQPITEGSEVTRLPFEPTAGRGETETRHTEPPAVTPQEKTEKIPLLAPPAAPEDIMEAPPPKREILKSKTAQKIPDIMNNQPGKGTLPAVPLDAAGVREIPTQEWIPLSLRPEMETISPPQLEHKPAAETLPKEDSRPPALLFPKETLTESPPSAAVKPEPESPPPTEVKPEPEESAPVREQLPEPPAAEELASPLASNAEMNREVKNYLMETAPILEELSLLMTRVPSLRIEDFDPSKADVPVVPNDVFVLMDSTKRALQVLDSKTFAIIPPTKYAKFHSMIRESITQTYQGCEAVMNFFKQNTEEDLGKAQDHLLRARELIHKTTKGTDKPVRG